ncbi:MAG: cell division protein ZipA C-terminal FtsZ-binding domain-containing protein [Methylovulum sp.]|nr:cell division protein ZipA C-terminal FtsZ-binding domain-containing protein [Methylovulum sp.]
MDKELLRVVIIATGLLVIMGMLAWHFLKNKKFSQDLDFFADQEFTGNINESLVVHHEHDDFDVAPIEKTVKQSAQMLDDLDAELDIEDADPPPRFVAPDIIQFSVVSKINAGFNGFDLLKAFQIAELDYGSLKIFERLDAKRRVDFGVACMVEPGTFPDTDLEDFYCPGVVFFMQPAILDDALKVFDDFLEAVNLVAVELDGEILDHQRKPLTNVTIDLIRQSL